MKNSGFRWLLISGHFCLAVVLFFCHHTTIITQSITERLSLSGAISYYYLEERDSYETAVLIGFFSVFLLPVSFWLFTAKKRFVVLHVLGVILSAVFIFHFYALRNIFVVLPTWAPHEYKYSLVFYCIYAALIYCLGLHLFRVFRKPDI